jgi:hypothetical protein
VFQACFLTWVENLRAGVAEVIAFDGKTSRRSHDHAKGRKPLHLVSAWATGQRLVLGSRPRKRNPTKSPPFRLLLKSLDLTGALATIDAMGA